ncbi:uncharacterized protein LOC132314627 [Cornus florida]|uniref:uncharacterized protein LOC132314627 n=1 Tax=Cornus florida TaxID=4283 RepID=UPI00289CACA0|nr:uncharacterized protein LOC132314627 [Cornus florida]
MVFVDRTLYCHRPPPPPPPPWRPRSDCLNPAAKFFKASGGVAPTLHGIKSLSSVRSMSSSLVSSNHLNKDFCNSNGNCTLMTIQGYQSPGDSYNHLVKKDSLKCLVMHTALRALGSDKYLIDSGCWHFDSGSSNHVTNDRALFTTFEEDSDDRCVSFGDGGKGRIHGKGEIKFPGVGELKNVLYVEGSDGNLLSISQLCDDDFEVTFTQQGCLVTNKEGECVLKGIRTSGDIYVIQPDPLFLMVPAGFLVAEGEEEVSFVKLTTTTMEEEEDEDTDNSTINDDYYDLLSFEGKKLVLKKKIKKSDLCHPSKEGDLLSSDNAICFGSSRGWLAFIHLHYCIIYLYNPSIINHSIPCISLPPIDTLPSFIPSSRPGRKKSSSSSFNNNNSTTEHLIPQKIPAVSSETLHEDFFKKIVSCSLLPYSKSNSNHNCTVVTIQGYQSYQLAFCRIGDSSWTALEGTLDPYKDLVFFSEHQLFYALGSCGLEAWDLCNPASPKSTFITESMPPTMSFVNEGVECCCTRSYLVESSGDLLMVNRYYSRAICSKTIAFDVYRLDFVGKDWEYVPSLGDRVLVIGANHAESLSAHDFPGLFPNSIYFTAYNTSISNDLGFFNLEDKSIYRRHLGKKKVQPSPTWIVPQL